MNFRGGPGGVRRRAAAVVDITALVDVVFQLLIFFLLTSTYITESGQSSPKIDVDLPESNASADPNTIDDVIVTIDAAGSLSVEDEVVNIEQLSVILTRAKNAKPNTIVLVRGDQNVPYGRVAQVMELARVAQLQISIVTGGQ